MKSFLKMCFVCLLVFLPGSLRAADEKPVEETYLDPFDDSAALVDGAKIKVSGIIGYANGYLKLYKSVENYIYWQLGERWKIGKSLHGPDWPITIDFENGEEWWRTVEGLEKDVPFDNRTFLGKTQVELTGTLWIEPAAYFDPETGEEYVVMSGPGDTIYVESIRIIDRPDFPGTFYKYLTQYDDLTYDNPPYYAIIEPGDPDCQALHEFVSGWIAAVRDRDYAALKQTGALGGDEGEAWRGLDDPESWLHQTLFSSETLYQKALQGSSSPSFVLLRNDQSHYQGFDEEYEGFAKDDEYPGADVCFCLSGDCEGLWPITVKMRFDLSLTDDYVCISMGKEDGELVWGF